MHRLLLFSARGITWSTVVLYGLVLLLLPGFALAQAPTVSSRPAPLLIDLNADARQLPPKTAFTPDSSLPATALYAQLKAWKARPLSQPASRLLFEFRYEDAHVRYPALPVQVFLPAAYNADSAYPAVLYLHGATGQGSFDPGVIARDSSGLFIHYFLKQGYIVIKPYADNARQFSWNPNPFPNKTNYTFKVLELMVTALKKRLPLDEDRLFALGHSDGGDGAFCLGLYNPSQFAGFYCYNTMASQLFAQDMYVSNLSNKPLFLVHSDQDAPRPIGMMRKIVPLLKKAGADPYYKVYNGYQHFDKHLEKDLPRAASHLQRLRRQPLPASLDWECQDPAYNGTIHWLAITALNLNAPPAAWHKTYDFTYAFNGVQQAYYQTVPGGRVMARYANNVFTLQTSRVRQLELLLSPDMVDMDRPLTVVVNGQSKTYTPSYDRSFMIEQFTRAYDHAALWCSKIVVDVERE